MYKALDKVIIFRALDKVIIIYNVKLMWKCIPYQGRTLFIGAPDKVIGYRAPDKVIGYSAP